MNFASTAATVFIASIFTSPLLPTAHADPVNDHLFAQLQDADMDLRIAALRDLQTSLDPRLPEALLLLLRDEGNSIRRLAARGIGSRYWQISDDRIPTFVEALKTNSNTDFEDEGRMVSRAIALLSREYKSTELSRSANGRWVLYERYNRPCLIDTNTNSEELLGWSEDARVGFYCSQLLKEVDGYTPWHPTKEITAMEIGLDRRMTTMWAWIHGKGLRKLDHSKVFKALGINEDHVSGPGGFYVEHTGWADDQIRIQCDFMVFDIPEDLKPGVGISADDVTAHILWNLDTDQVIKVSITMK
tara:strand:+ start:1970 stop:2875 length:906 start_codon:yes stop_codon:yes gene_type:complete